MPPAGMDFNDDPVIITIPAGSNQACGNIPIASDSVSEGPEQFCVRLNISASAERAMIVGPAECPVTVTITDPS